GAERPQHAYLGGCPRLMAGRVPAAPEGPGQLPRQGQPLAAVPASTHRRSARSLSTAQARVGTPEAGNDQPPPGAAQTPGQTGIRRVELDQRATSQKNEINSRT